MPLVSALMATYNRRAFVGRAIRCFLDQRDVDAELVILDDGDDPIIDLVPADPRIRYLFEPRRPLGEKFARLVQEARGEYLAMFDDDDWHGPDRLARQAAALDAGAPLCLIDRFYGYDAAFDRAVRWDWRPYGAFSDGTVMFTRGFYESGVPFAADDAHPTQAMIAARGIEAAAWVDGGDLYVQHLHATNLATRAMRGPGWIDVPDAGQLVRDRLGIQVPATIARPSPAASTSQVSKVKKSKSKPRPVPPDPPVRLSWPERRRRIREAQGRFSASPPSGASGPSASPERSNGAIPSSVSPASGSADARSAPQTVGAAPAVQEPRVFGPHVKFRKAPTRGVAGRASRAAARARD